MKHALFFSGVLSICVFLQPSLSSAVGRSGSEARDIDLSDYNHVDPKHIVPEVPLRQALTYLKANPQAFRNQTYLGIVDFTEHSNKNRILPDQFTFGRGRAPRRRARRRIRIRIVPVTPADFLTSTART